MMLGDSPAIPMASLKGTIVYTLYGASLALSWLGLRLFYDRAVPLLQVVVLSFATGLFYCLLLHFGVSMRWAFSVVFGLIALSTALCIFEILRTPSQERLWTQYVVLLGFAGYFIAFVTSIIVIHVASERMATPENGIYSLLFDLWCGVFIQVGYLAMVGERANVKLSHLAGTDPLTGLFNRRGLLAEIERRSRNGRAVSGCAVLLADIDRFKSINDTYGHDGGDAVLVGFAGRLRSIMRKDDLIVRWGGEEFLVVLDGADSAQASAVAERLRAAVAAQTILVGAEAIAVTVSIGVSVKTVDEGKIDAAVGRADTALYAAKKGGRNQVRVESAPARAANALGMPCIPSALDFPQSLSPSSATGQA